MLDRRLNPKRSSGASSSPKMDIGDLFEDEEQRMLLENLERLRNVSMRSSEQEIRRIINSTAVLSSDSNYDRSTEILLIALYSILALLGLSLNTFMSCVILFSKKLLRNPSNLLVLNLMTSDLLMLIFCVPFTLMSIIWKSWMFGEALCKLIPFLQSVSMIACSATISMIAIDRAIRVTKNISSYSYHVLYARTHWIMIATETALIWIFAILISLPIAFFQILLSVSIHNTLIFRRCVEFWPNAPSKQIYSIGNAMIQFLLPTIILITANIKIKNHLSANLSGLDARATHQDVSSKECEVTVSMDNSMPTAQTEANGSVRQKMLMRCSSLFQLVRSSSRSPSNLTVGIMKNNSFEISDPELLEKEDPLLNNNQGTTNSLPRRYKVRYNKRNDTINRNRCLLMREISRNQKVTRTLFSIVFTFTITWLPWNLFNIYVDFHRDTPLEPETELLITAFCYLIAMTTIPVNAFLYGWANPSIRSEALIILGFFKRTIADVDTTANQTHQRSTHLFPTRSEDGIIKHTRGPVKSASA